MSGTTRTSRAPAEKRLTYQQWKRRKNAAAGPQLGTVSGRLRGGGADRRHPVAAAQGARSAGRAKGICSQRVRRDYVFNAADARLVLVNANLPYTAEPAPLLDTADEATGQLEAEAAMQYRSMAAAAQADGVSLTLGGRLSGRRHPSGRLRGPKTLPRKRKRGGSRQSAAVPSSPPPTPTSTAPATRQISSARTIRSRTPVLPRPAPTSGSRPTRRNTALSCATRRTGRPPPASCSSRGTGAMWGWKTPLPSAPAA